MMLQIGIVPESKYATCKVSRQRVVYVSCGCTVYGYRYGRISLYKPSSSMINRIAAVLSALSASSIFSPRFSLD
jgi:hypothetical protein